MVHATEEHYLLATREEEFVRVNAIRDSTSNNRHPVEDYGRLIRVLERKLVEDIGQDGKYNKSRKTGRNEERN